MQCKAHGFLDMESTEMQLLESSILTGRGLKEDVLCRSNLGWTKYTAVVLSGTEVIYNIENDDICLKTHRVEGLPASLS